MNKKSGFSLVELSIVLIIIGLLVAGVTSGDRLIKQGQLKKTISQINEVKTAIRIFDQTYDALPGDMSNASSYWSGAANGDGDDKVETSESDNEWYDHLVLAELIGGFERDGTGRPLLSFIRNGIEFEYNNRSDEYSYKHLLFIRDHYAATVDANGSDTYYLDSKIDDGHPYAGQTMGTSSSSSCNSSGVLSSANCCANYYSISNSSFAAATAAGSSIKYNRDSVICNHIYIEVPL